MIDRTMEQIGNYRIIRLIDRGGFAHVYLGEHIYLGTQVAIKTLNATLTSEDRDSFLTEARTLAHLIHSHIVRVLDYAILNGVPFLIMDYAPNGSLRQQYPKGQGFHYIPPFLMSSKSPEHWNTLTTTS